VDLAAQALDVSGGDPETRLRDVADDHDDAIVADAPAAATRLEAALGALANEDVDRPLALEQALDEVPPDEPGCSRHEVAHLASSTLRPDPTTSAWAPGPLPARRVCPRAGRGRQGKAQSELQRLRGDPALQRDDPAALKPGRRAPRLRVVSFH